MTLYVTNSKGGEMTPLDLSPLTRPARRTKHNRPVRHYRQRYYWRQVDIESLVLVNLLGLAALALLLT